MATVKIGNNTGDDFSGTADAKIDQTSPDDEWGGLASMEITKYAAASYIHTVIKFSGIDSLPDILTVSSVTLYLYLEGSEGTSYNIQAKVLNRSFTETQVTWNDYITATPWTTAGATHEPNDRSATTTFDILDNATIEYHSFSSAGLASDVEDMADGTLSNYGWHLERTDTPVSWSKYKTFTSRNGADGRRPYLSVTYTAGGGGPVKQASSSTGQRRKKQQTGSGLIIV